MLIVMSLENFNPYFNGFRMSVGLIITFFKDSYNFNPYFNGFRMSVGDHIYFYHYDSLFQSLF